jgi:cytochrome c oxidase assembly protein subunit 15
MTTPGTEPVNVAAGSRGAVIVWLAVVAALVFAMVVLGGVTRLTESGLSMTEWRPVTGWLPPMSQEAWQEVFDKYRTSPEYQQINAGMSLDAFKTIFWFEYAHRLLGRIIGLAFFLPFVAFLLMGRLDRPLTLRLLCLLGLGALQGLMGWLMVKSGLVDRPSVSQYRLALHLLLAFVIYGALVWTILGLRRAPDYGPAETGLPRRRRIAGGLLALISLTVVSGAFVAGLDAGRYYNTFPLMDGALIPPDYGSALPWWQNAFENIAAVQFHHRVIAIVSVIAALGTWLVTRASHLTRRTRHAAAALAAMAVLQAGLGIATLLAYVPVWLGALHQAGALVLFTLAIMLLASLRQRRA